MPESSNAVLPWHWPVFNQVRDMLFPDEDDIEGRLGDKHKKWTSEELRYRSFQIPGKTQKDERNRLAGKDYWDIYGTFHHLVRQDPTLSWETFDGHGI